MTKKVIVTTTINEPTKALKLYSEFSDWDLVVVGDTKTPEHLYKDIKCTYLNPQDQENLDKPLSDMIGWKCIQRRNMGFLYALKNNYSTIATIDDDNIPYKNWGTLFTPQTVSCYNTDFNFFDPLSVTNYSHLWHRGFPLQHVNIKNNVSCKKMFSSNFDVQCNFWDGDPDIDAVCRMIYKPECTFDIKEWFTTNCFTPFNSQNTILTREALKSYFMFDKVGRMDDIFGSYILQKKGFNVVFGPSTVYQERNEHDLTVDMKKEYIGYENVKNIIDDTSFINFDSYNRYLELTSVM